MLSATMRSAVTQALRPCARGLPAKPLPSRGVLVRRSFLVAPSYKLRVAVRGFATATASKTTGRSVAKPATKTKAKPKAKAKATTTKAKKTAKAKPAKKKKVVAKPKKPVGRKKELSPEKKEAQLKRELKKKSLMGKEPKNLPATKWVVFMSNALKGKPSGGIGDTRQRMSTISSDFKSLSPAELERLEETAVQNKAVNAGNWKTWIESHSIAEIQQANVARRRLKRTFNVSAFPLKLVDERLPKRPASNAFAYFLKARRPDIGNVPARQLTKQLSEEWSSLPALEKKPYQDLASAEYSKFQKEMEKLSI